MSPEYKPPRAEIGILGGTGLYQIEGLSDIQEINLDTPFGAPSDSYMIGRLEGRSVAFLGRHGRGHRILPSEINYCANIFGFKRLGVERIISVNSVGSLKEEIRPQDFVLPDQFFDRSKRRNTFFGGGIVAHISFAHPVCPAVTEALFSSGKNLGLSMHQGGTYICIEGPSFSCKAESHIYRQWGCDIIGMTSATEARLCREAEICYATLSMITDYDVWKETGESVSVEMIVENNEVNTRNAAALLKKTVAALPLKRGNECSCGEGLKNAIFTSPDIIPEERKKALKPIIGKYIPS